MDIEDNDYSSDDSEVTTADQDLMGKTDFFFQFYFHYLPSIAIRHDAYFSMFFVMDSTTPFEK